MSCGDATDGIDGQKAEAMMPKRRAIRRVDRGTCQKCREAKSKFIIRSAPYCTPCFELNVFSRFTRQLYPPLHPPRPNESKKHNTNQNLYRPARRSSNVIVALSGGAGSMAMFDMLTRGGYVGQGEGTKEADMTKGEKEIIWEKGYAVHVDFSGVLPPSASLEDDNDWMKTMVEARGFVFVELKAEDVFDPTLVERLGGEGNSGKPIGIDLKAAGLPVYPAAESSYNRTPLEKLHTLLSSLPPPSRPSILSTILTSLLNTASSSLPNISHLLTGETSTRQASRVISATASGRGWALPLELASTTTLPSGVIQLNLMKEASLKEASYVCRIHGMTTRNYRGWGKAGGNEKGRESRGKGGAMSIEGLTEQFIASLDVTHPATVSTITRTGGKLVFPGEKKDEALCPLCQMPKDPSALEWKARTALTSLYKTPKSENSDPINARDARHQVDLAHLLCYACLTTLTPSIHYKKVSEVEGVETEMPLWVGERVKVGRKEMKAEIQEFLLQS